METADIFCLCHCVGMYIVVVRGIITMTDISWSMRSHSFRLQHMATKCLDRKKNHILTGNYHWLHTYICVVYLGTAYTQIKKYSQMKRFPLLMQKPKIQQNKCEINWHA